MHQLTIKPKKWFQISKMLGVIGLLSHFCAVMADAVPIYESRSDHNRTGVNLHETILNTSNVNPANFGLIFTLPVNGYISNELLYVPNLTINNAIHNVIYVTTRTNMVYAYDADRAGPALWVQQLNGGIKSTPVIDPKTNTLYLVTQNPPIPPYQFSIHALDLISGAEKFGAPQIMTGNFGALALTNQSLQQHAGLTLANNNLIIAFAGYNEDLDNTYHGWVSAYNASNLQLVGTFSPLGMPPATGAGIWQGGRAPVVDGNGNIYLFVGNSWANAVNSNTYDGMHNFTMSLLKFDSNLNLLDWFTPGNWNTLDIMDLDLSSSGPILIPGTSLLTGGGKEGNLYIWNINNLGKYQANDTQVVQKFKAVPNGSVYSGPIFWTRSAQQGGSVLYTLGMNSPIYAYSFNGNTFNTTPISTSSASNATGTSYRSAITLSANADTTGTGIIWELQNNPAGGSVVRALDATNLSNELWNSTDVASDVLTGQTTYVPPIITNGKVYVSAYNNNNLSVYGLLTTPTTIAAPTSAQNTYLGAQANLAISATGTGLTFSATKLPPGLSINASTGVITGTTTTTGKYTPTISAANIYGVPQTTSFVWYVTATPVITQPANQTSMIGSTVNLPIIASDNGFTMKYSATGLPAGLTINLSTGVISGTVTATAGTYPVSITAANYFNQHVNTSFNWIIAAPASTVTITPPATPQNTYLGGQANLAIIATDSKGFALTYMAKGLPPGLSINASTGVITGTTTATGKYTPTISVTANNEVPQTTSFVWYVTATPVITQPANQTSTIGSTVNLPIVVSDNGFAMYYKATGLPAGLTINLSTGVISGTVTAIAGTYPVSVTAANYFNQHVSTSFNWTIQ